MTPSALPPPHGIRWPEAMADEAGMNWMWLEEAARFAAENETPWPRDLRLHLEGGFFEPPPHNEILGPIRPRGEPNGLVLRGRAARWWAGATRSRWISPSPPPRAISACWPGSRRWTG